MNLRLALSALKEISHRDHLDPGVFFQPQQTLVPGDNSLATGHSALRNPVIVRIGRRHVQLSPGTISRVHRARIPFTYSRAAVSHLNLSRRIRTVSSMIGCEIATLISPSIAILQKRSRQQKLQNAIAEIGRLSRCEILSNGHHNAIISRQKSIKARTLAASWLRDAYKA
jgi:hypothetical protein